MLVHVLAFGGQMDKWEHVHHDVQSLIDHRLAVAEDEDMTLDLAGTALDCSPSAVDPFSIIVATQLFYLTGIPFPLGRRFAR